MKKALILLSVLMVLVPGIASANQLVNSGFETGSLTPWTLIGYHTASVSTAAERTGNYGLRMNIESPVQGDGWGGRYQNFVAVPEQQHYLKAWVNTTYLNEFANASIQISYFDVANPNFTVEPIAVFDSSAVTGLGWTERNVLTDPAPGGTRTVRYTLASWGIPDSPWGQGAGYAYFDDVDGDTIPEPSSLILLGSGVLGMLGITKKKKNSIILFTN